MLPSQKEMLERAPVDEIAHGVQLPVDLLEKYCSHTIVHWGDGKDYDLGPGVLWNPGSGGDMNKVNQLRKMGFQVINTDINTKVVINERGKNLVSIKSDAETFGDRMGLMSIMLLEKVPTVWMGGLLENMGTNWQGAIKSAFMSLTPLGFLVIGGVARADLENVALKNIIGDEKFTNYREMWEHRYKTANRYNSRRYPYGIFPVARPGEMKYLEWGSSSDVDRLVHSEFYERDAQHMNVGGIIQYAQEMGMKLIINRDEVWSARTHGDIYSGYTIILQKENKYSLDPFRAGLSFEEGVDWAYRTGGTDKISREIGLEQYWRRYRLNLIKNAARKGLYPSATMFAYLERLVRGRGDDGLPDKTGWDWLMPDPNDM